MAQTLYAQVRDEKGDMHSKEVKVFRSWQDAGGAQIFLHANGVYGYKDGAPIKYDSEFDIIGDGVQKVIALEWWEKSGKKMSTEYYAARDKKIYDLQQRRPTKKREGGGTAMDMVLYKRRSTQGGKQDTATTEPMTWYTWFDERPEWWGYAKMIEIGNFSYNKYEVGAKNKE